MTKTFLFASDPDTDCAALYDENGKLIYSWQYGDDPFRILKNILGKFDVSLNSKSISVDDCQFPDKI